MAKKATRRASKPKTCPLPAPDLRGWTYRKSCCGECPWQRSAKLGKFPVERYQTLAATAYDMARTVFTCHMSSEDVPAMCAGFLLRGAYHNLTVRMESRVRRTVDLSKVQDRDGLYDNYREMAIANGVDPDDPVLIPCRD